MDIFAYSVNKMEQKIDLPQILGKESGTIVSKST